MRTANPALNESAFDAVAEPYYGAGATTMSVQGTVNRTAFLMLFLLLGASWTWSIFHRAATLAEGAQAVMPWLLIGLFGGLVFGFVTIFAKRHAMVLAPIYCVCQGLFLGALSAIMEAQFPGIVIQAVGLTFGVLAALLLAYTSRLIRPSENFKLGVVAATGGIAVFYLASIVLGLFHVQMPLIHSSGPAGILFSLFVVTIAALNLVLDFDFIEHGAERGAPKYMEWYAAFGLMVTLVWLYIEILRLLSKLRRR